MKERPIIFNAEMVKAILEGRKTQTRRVAKPQPSFSEFKIPKNCKWIDCPYGQVGDRLWVRETWGMSGFNRIEYKAFPADGKDFRSVDRWRSPYHLFKKDSRITLEITDVRVERLQEISPDDVIAEGIIEEDGDGLVLRDKFENLWNSIHKKKKVSYIGDGTKNREIKIPSYTWQDNPWVWCLTFKRRVR